MTPLLWIVLALPPQYPPPKDVPAPKAKACLCSTLCTCGCQAGKKCRCQVTHGVASSSVTPSEYRPAPTFPVLGPVIRFVTPGGGRPANC